MKERLRTFFLGRRLEDSKLSDEKFNILWGIPVFASDAISSVSYAGEEILLVLIPVLGMASYKSFLPIVAAIIGLLGILVFCYRQTIDAYPQGGGAYIVATDNLGETPGLVAGAALIIGYILTVAVSACAGAAAVTSAFPELLQWKALIALILIALLTWGNLRGLRESAVMFGVPTYLFIFTMLTLIVVGIVRYASGSYTPQETVIAAESSKDMLLFVILRAFASGCTALTGVEAVSNGVPNFKEPAPKNAKKVLYAMAGFVCIVFFGVSVLISMYRIVPNEEATAVSQLAEAVFGSGSALYYVVQVMTVVILTLAANTAFAGLPLLMALMAQDGYLPRQLIYRGTRLNFSNGILFLFASAALLVIAFNGDQHLLLPLYAAGVFLSFLLSQLGMVLHWVRRKGSGWQTKAFVNGFGTIITGITLVIIVMMKFLQGAWVTLVCIILLVLLMRTIKKHYDKVRDDLRISSPEEAVALMGRGRVGKLILPVQNVNRSFVKVLNCAKDLDFDEIEYYHICSDEASAKKLQEQIERLGVPGNFVYEVTHYRNTEEVLMRHIEAEHAKLDEHQHLTVMMPNLVMQNRWARVLHNQTTKTMIKRMEKYRNVYVFQIPYSV